MPSRRRRTFRHQPRRPKSGRDARTSSRGGGAGAGPRPGLGAVGGALLDTSGFYVGPRARPDDLDHRAGPRVDGVALNDALAQKPTSRRAGLR